MKEKFSVSIVIPIREAPKDALKQLAYAIYSQTIWPQEIILVSAESKEINSFGEEFRALFRHTPSIRTVFAENAFPGEARNIGTKYTNAALIAFLDVCTLPDTKWLESSCVLINQNLSDGIIGNCKFIGKTFFSWILIDSFFGRGTVSTLPGSIFTTISLKKVGPFLEKVRAGEDNEWFQRASMMNVNFLQAPGTTTCQYYGYQEFNFIKFVKKWNQNYRDASKLPQYKLISQFNIILWSSFSLILFFNWNSIFAEWDTSHPMYLPHVTKIVFVLILIAYFFLRSVYLPISRGTNWRFILSYRLPFIMTTVLTADLIKIFFFLRRGI